MISGDFKIWVRPTTTLKNTIEKHIQKYENQQLDNNIHQYMNESCKSSYSYDEMNLIQHLSKNQKLYQIICEPNSQ